MIIDIEYDVPYKVVGDAHRLCQVFVNLLGNAAKFTHKGGEVVLRVSLESNPQIQQLQQQLQLQQLQQQQPHLETKWFKFSVSDTGVGIPEEGREKLFQPFSQHDQSITRKFGGSGLGLAISKKLVELMVGNISFTSQPDKVCY